MSRRGSLRLRSAGKRFGAESTAPAGVLRSEGPERRCSRGRPGEVGLRSVDFVHGLHRLHGMHGLHGCTSCTDARDAQGARDARLLRLLGLHGLHGPAVPAAPAAPELRRGPRKWGKPRATEGGDGGGARRDGEPTTHALENRRGGPWSVPRLNLHQDRVLLTSA